MRRITQVDQGTGEELGGFVAVIRPKQKSAFQRHFTMNQAALITIANELNHDQMRVLMALHGLARRARLRELHPGSTNGHCRGAEHAKNKCQPCGKNPDRVRNYIGRAEDRAEQNISSKPSVRLERHGKQPQESITTATAIMTRCRGGISLRIRLG